VGHEKDPVGFAKSKSFFKSFTMAYFIQLVRCFSFPLDISFLARAKGTLTKDFKLYTLSIGMNAAGLFQASLILFTASLVGMEPW
jgi:hypothetical protein